MARAPDRPLPSRGSSVAEAVPLVGRSAELEELKRVVSDAREGRPRLILIEGEPGIGKTRLLDEALGELDSNGTRLFRATCEELEKGRPFGVIADALRISRTAEDPRRKELSDLLNGTADRGETGPAFPPTRSSQYFVVEAVVTFLEELSADGPTLVAIDDLQWTDPESALVLHRMGRYARQLNASLFCSYRHRPREPHVERLIQSLAARGATKVNLAPLSPDDLAELVRETVGAEPGPTLLQQVAASGGNPFFATELLNTLSRDGSIDTTPQGGAELAGANVPASLALTILHRLSFLSSETLEILRLSSILGSSFPVADLAVVMGRPPVDLLKPLREAIDARVLYEEGDRLAFRHDLIRESLYQDLPEPLRTTLHLEAGKALARHGAPPEDVAEHFVRGGRPGDHDAIQLLHAAAKAVVGRAPLVASDLLGKALSLTAPDDPARDRLLADRAVSLMWSGSLADAEAICRDALSVDQDARTEGVLLWCLVQTLLARGRPRDAADVVEAAVASPRLLEGDRVRLQARGAMAKMLAGDLQDSAITAEQALVDSERVGDAAAVCIATMVLALCAYFSGEFQRAADLGTRAVALADRSRDAHLSPLHLYLALILMDLDRFEEADEKFQLGRHVSEEIGSKWNIPIYHWASTAFWSGRWDDAIADFETGLALAEEIGTRHGIVVSHAVRALIAIHRNEIAVAEEAVAAGEKEFSATGPQYRFHWMMWARALLREAQGHPQEALQTISAAWSICAATGVVAEYAVIAPDLVRLAVAEGDLALAREATAAVEEVAGRAEAPWTRGAASRCRGLVENDPQILLQAVQHYRRGPRPRELALACEDAAVALAADSDRDTAKPLLHDALRIYEELDAAGDAARAERRARAVGLARQTRSRRRKAVSGWESLTETELKVAGLVASGLSNPQIGERLFVSRRTVQTHVSHILAKLQLSSRVEVAAEAAKRS